MDLAGPGRRSRHSSGHFESDATVRVEVTCGTVEIRTTEGDTWTVEGLDETGVGPSVQADGESLEVTPPDGDVGTFLGERDTWVVRLPTAHRLDLHLTVDAGEAVTDIVGARLGVVEVELNAGKATVNLRDATEVDGIDVGINAGTLGLYLPAVSTTGSIQANAGSIRLCAPEGVALRLETGDSVLSSQDFEAAGLVQNGDAWETPGYDTAVIRIELQTEANAGSFSLNPPEGCS